MPKTILAVDSVNRLLIQLKNDLGKDYNIITANSGKECIAALTKNKVDLLLMELLLRDIPGDKILSAITRNGIKVPCLVLTAETDKAKHKAAIYAGAIDVLKKPCKTEDLKYKIDSILSHEPFSEEKETILNKVLYSIEAEYK